MKTYKNLYQAFRKARRGGKRKKESVAAFELDLEANLWQLAMECFERGLLTETKDMARTTELYYVMCGWDKETGAPTEGKLHELGSDG